MGTSKYPAGVVTAKDRDSGKTTEVFSVWESFDKEDNPIIFEGKYGQRKAYQLAVPRGAKGLKIQITTADGDKINLEPGKKGNCFLNLLMDVPGDAEDDGDF